MSVGIEDIDQQQERLEEQGRLAERWKAHHAEAFAALPSGTTVVINLTTGDYVTASGWHEAYDAFDQIDGSTTQVCVARANIDWLSEPRLVRVFVSNGWKPMVDAPVGVIGTGLLSPNLLLIDYAERSVEIESVD